MSDTNIVLGILGGGQLGRMMIAAASNLGIKTSVLDSSNQCPAAPFCESVKTGSLYDSNAIELLLKSCTIATIEIEHLNAEETLSLSRKLQIPVYPTMESLIMIQDKYKQKQILQDHGFSVAPFCSLSDLFEYTSNFPSDSISEKYITDFFNNRFNLCFGFPLLIKSKKNAYDGHGTFKINDTQELKKFILKYKNESVMNTHYIEAYVPFIKELSVLTILSRDNDQSLISTYPVVETIQHNHICHAVIAPAQISSFITDKAVNMAKSIIQSLFESSAGLFAIEMFLLNDGNVLINEIAPRPHNSGHFSIDACITSQFENHVRAVLKMPLGSTRMTRNTAVMINILGDGNECSTLFQKRLELAMRRIPDLKVHWYGKSEARKGRKLGHLTLCGDSIHDILYSLSIELSKCDIPFHVNVSQYGTQSTTNSLLAHFGGLISHSYMNPMIGIIMGSDSDMGTMSQAIRILENFPGISFEVTLVSAHRTPKRLIEYGQSAYNRGIRVIIAGAGGAAHLPGMIASLTTLPVIGVPIVSASMASMNGQDALYSILQMPTGIPVATVAIENAANAALMALRILASGYTPSLHDKIYQYQKNMEQGVLDKVSAISKLSSIQSLMNSLK